MYLSIGKELGVLVPYTPEKAPEIKTEFAVCELLLRRLPVPQRPLSSDQAKIIALGIALDAHVYRFSDADQASEAWKRLATALGERQLRVIAVTGAQIDGSSTTPIMVLEEPAAEQRFIGEDTDGLVAAHRAMIRTDMEVMERFSRLTGLCVHYCLAKHVVQPPMPHEHGVLNIHVGARPPGHYQIFSQAVKNLFGCDVWGDGEERKVHGPTSWRGRLVSAEGVPIFQVLGNNAYQFVLVLAECSSGLRRVKLWEEMLSLLARDLAEAHDDALPEPTAEELQRCVREMAESRSVEIRQGLEKIDYELDDLQRKLAEKLRQRLTQVTSLKALEHEAVALAERTADDFVRLRSMPDVAAIHANPEDGLMVETVPIALERDGRRYDLGPFRIHVAPDGQVAIWSESPKHPDGHHHPHIDKTSLECFGNITLAVAKLATAYRLAETVEIVIRWLRSYRPELTLIPLEGFPSQPIGEPREEKRTEPLAAAQAAGSESRSSGDAPRRRSGRKPRRAGARQDGRAADRRLGRR